MRFRFPEFCIEIARFTETSYKKIKVVWVRRLDLFRYTVSFVRL